MGSPVYLIPKARRSHEIFDSMFEPPAIRTICLGLATFNLGYFVASRAGPKRRRKVCHIKA